jgi:hypothetical protein
MESNLNEVVNRVVVRMESLKNPDKMLRSMALATLSNILKRVHTDGKATDGSQIGMYSKSYLAVRSGNFENASKYKKGAKKGQVKNAGFISKGKHAIYDIESKGVVAHKNSMRPTFNRGADPKVVLSLTRQMEGDMTLVALSKGGYGVGYQNSTNLQKANWAELTYEKRIWGLATEEEEAVRAIAQNYVKEALNDR